MLEWILIVWITGDPGSTGVLTQPDEQTCRDTLELWEGITPRNTGYCVYGNLERMNLEEYFEQTDQENRDTN